jgi:SPP1 family predicted phage head-tail adaptor
MPTGAGALDRRIQIQRATEAPDAAGQNILTFADWIPRSANVKHLSGRELQAAQQLVADVDTRFILRYDSETATITADETFRIVYGARVYDVKHSQEDTDQGRRRYWKILARGRAEVAA